MSNNPPQGQPPEPSGMNVKWYILKHRKPVRCDDIHKVNKMMGNQTRKRVRSTYIGDYWISTVFLFLDHDLNSNEPILFETMVFLKGDMGDEQQYGASTWREALNMHWRTVDEVKQIIKG